MNSIHLIMPMAGRGSRFKNKGFDFPKPLIEIYGKPFFYWAVRSVEKFNELESLDFVVLKEHVDNYKIDKVIKDYFPKGRIHVLPEVTEGAVITCKKGVEKIEDNLPVVFNDCDQLFKNTVFNEYNAGKYSINDRENDISGILLTFKATEPKYSFVKKDDKGNIIGTVEKEAVSNEAICGCYCFKDKDTFIDNADRYLKNCNYSEYFMSGVYNVMIDKGLVVKSFSNDFHLPYGEPSEYEIAKTKDLYRELL